jgi:hypothetical protein
MGVLVGHAPSVLGGGEMVFSEAALVVSAAFEGRGKGVTQDL